MATAQPAPPSLSVDSTLGAVFIGFAVACCVYGVLVTQIFSYFREYPSDKVVLKLMVIAILLLETADQAFIGHLVYFYSISNFANPGALLRGSVTWSFILQLTMGAVVGTLVKGAFGLRVWRFSDGNIYITAVILALTTSQLGLAIGFTVKAFALPNVFAVSDLQILGTLSLAAGVLTDLITAISLCYFLSRFRTGYSPSDGVVKTLIRYAINTGILTSTVSITTLVLYNAMPQNNLYFVATYFILSKLYAISYLATLNSRRITKGRGTDRQGVTATNNDTNMFHLGTRLPSMGPADLGRWDSDMMKVAPEDDFPMNSFHPGVGKTRGTGYA